MAGDSGATEWHRDIMNNLKDFNETSLKSIADDISKRRKVFLNVVETLGPNLTNTDPTIRHDALRVVVTILENLDRSALNQAETETLARFLCDRLHDHQSLTGLTLRGFVALVQIEEFPGEMAVIILNSMANDVFVPTMPKGERHDVYKMMDVMVYRFESVLRVMGSNLLMRFIAFMDGEHEPRNLIICFRVMTRILERFEIEPLVEAAFDVVACYFPIDFTPTTQEDIESRLKETLVTGLRRCLTSTPKFAKFLLPLLMEKIMSDARDSKEEALHTLVTCCESHPPKDALLEQLPLLWPAVRREVLASSSDSIEEAALEALTKITATIASGPQQDKSGVDQFIATALKDMDPFLKKPELQLQYPAGKILRAISLGSDLACSQISSALLPAGVQLFMEHKQPDSRLAIVSVMTLQLRTMAEMKTTFSLPNKSSIATFYQSLLTETPQNMITCMGISGLGRMLKIRESDSQPFLEADKVKQVCKILTEGMMTYENSGVIDEVVNFFTVVGQEEDEQFIYENLLPRLLDYLQGHEVLPIPIRLVDIVTAVLKTSRPKRTATFIPKLLERIVFLDDNGPYVPTMKMYLDIIAVYVEGISSTMEAEYLYELVLYPTFGKAIRAATSEDTSGYQDIAILQSLSRVYRGIISRLDHTSFATLVQKLDKMYLSGDMSYKSLTSGRRREQLFGSAFKPLETPYVTTHTRCISLMTSIVCSAPKGFEFTHEHWEAEIRKMMETCCFCADEQSSVFAAQFIGGVLNRVENNQALDAFIHDILDDPVLAKARSQERRLVRTLIWMTKGLVLASRRDDYIKKFTADIVKYLRSKKSGEEAADGIRIILEESSFVLKVQMNAHVSPLYRQKFFNIALPMLLDSFKEIDGTGEPWMKRNHLIALSYLLKFVPQTVARPHMAEIVPFLLQSLNSADPDLLLSTLNSVEELLLDSDADSVSAALGTRSIPPLIDMLLELCITPSNMHVRIAALRCLGFIGTQLPTPPLQPFKQKVLRRLSKCLDDKKRRVREVAVDTRGSWFLVGTAR